VKRTAFSLKPQPTGIFSELVSVSLMEIPVFSPDYTAAAIN